MIVTALFPWPKLVLSLLALAYGLDITVERQENNNVSLCCMCVRVLCCALHNYSTYSSRTLTRPNRPLLPPSQHSDTAGTGGLLTLTAER